MPLQKGVPRAPGAGRKKGTPNKATAKRQAEIAATGITPLEYLLQEMRKVENEPSVRIDAAKAAAPYVHPKLSSVDINGSLNATLVIRHDWKGRKGEG